MTRAYLPTIAELFDRLSIVLLKQIFIGEHQYVVERDLIESDLEQLLRKGPKLRALDVRALLMLAIANRFIWENESQARKGHATGNNLLATHSVNGVRNRAKNILAARFKERTDGKIDCLAANLPPEFGNWDVFD